MKVSLFVSCLVDTIAPQVGVATVELLRRAGCTVDFDPRQTCCGQPAFNSGHKAEACRVAQGVLDALGSGEDPIVVPSGSCAAMLLRLPSLFEEGEDHERACSIAARTRELSQFLVQDLKVTDLGARWPGRVTWHDACHTLRELDIHSEPRQLLSEVRDLEQVEAIGCDTCCGFGGTFAVKHAEVSVAMADWKIRHIEEAGVTAVVSSDVSCLLQLGGRLKEMGSKVRALHLAEVLNTR
ncbi:MAG: Fe-S oxidoreductase [Planctomycetes bacterium]|nr:Fe-S oxidoreductase [Planctomycetota bacterium]HJM56353.1 (Fe-S)-binding protein [Planctomycetota bacterium]